MKKKRHIGRYKKTPYKQGIYKPVHSEKYKGCRHPEYRSSWELKFFQWCDKNTNVIKWGSETVVVPYISPVDGKLHRYFVDNIVTLKEGGNVKTYLVEIKPSKQTVAPIFSKRKKRLGLLRVYHFSEEATSSQNFFDTSLPYLHSRSLLF